MTSTKARSSTAASHSEEFDLEAEGGRLEKRLHFLSTWPGCGRWQLAGRSNRTGPPSKGRTARTALAQWLATARAEQASGCLLLLDAVRTTRSRSRRARKTRWWNTTAGDIVKLQLLHTGHRHRPGHVMAVGTLRERRGAGGRRAAGTSSADPSWSGRAWEPSAIQMEQALLRGEPAVLRAALAAFLERFQAEPLLVHGPGGRRAAAANPAGAHGPERSCGRWWPTCRGWDCCARPISC